MKIIEKQDLTCSDIEVTIKYKQKNELVHRIITLLESADMQIRCERDGIQRQVNVSDIYYIESVDKKSFLYLEKQVYHMTGSLYMAMGDHFVNNTIVNMLHVVSGTGTDEFMVMRIAIAQSVAFIIVCIWYKVEQCKSFAR